jgi:hypothetical protein
MAYIRPSSSSLIKFDTNYDTQKAELERKHVFIQHKNFDKKVIYVKKIASIPYIV